MKIWLLKHPVSPEQKAQARAAGVRIIDAKFSANYAQADLYQPDAKPAEDTPAPKPKRRRKSKTSE